jgi:hypothetical protein
MADDSVRHVYFVCLYSGFLIMVGENLGPINDVRNAMEFDVVLCLKCNVV